jgi:hypothetical protein
VLSNFAKKARFLSFSTCKSLKLQVHYHLNGYAMREADQQLGNHDGMTDILELAQYVGDHVSALTQRMFGLEQSPQVLVKGQNFPIGAVLKTQP